METLAAWCQRERPPARRRMAHAIFPLQDQSQRFLQSLCQDRGGLTHAASNRASQMFPDQGGRPSARTGLSDEWDELQAFSLARCLAMLVSTFSCFVVRCSATRPEQSQQWHRPASQRYLPSRTQLH